MANDGRVAEYLKTSDRCLAWLAYIHLIEFNILPSKFYDPSNANPSRIVNIEPFVMPWQAVQDVKTNPDMLFAVFEGKYPFKKLIPLLRKQLRGGSPGHRFYFLQRLSKGI